MFLKLLFCFVEIQKSSAFSKLTNLSKALKQKTGNPAFYMHQYQSNKKWSYTVVWDLRNSVVKLDYLFSGHSGGRLTGALVDLHWQI